MSKKSNNPDVFLQVESALAAVPRNAAAVLLIRHGEKMPMESVPVVANSPLGEYDLKRMLTSRGKTDAKIMGRLLMGRIIRIDHSGVPRCRQTAEYMIEGAGFDGDIRENRISEKLYTSDAMKKGKENTGGFANLINTLAVDGCYAGFNPVRPFMTDMTSKLLSVATPGINVSVSHDWIVYLMLITIGIKVKPFAEERISYLEPIFLWQEGKQIFYHYRNEQGVCDDSVYNFVETKQ